MAPWDPAKRGASDAGWVSPYLPVLAGLGGGEGSDLAWELTLHHDQGAWLHAASFSQLDVGRAGITLFELVVRHLN